MKCKKGKLLDNFGQWIFIDEYGICNVSIQKITINDKSFDQVFAFIPKNKRYERLVFDNGNTHEIVNTIFSSDLATRKPTQNNGYYYGYRDLNAPFTSADAVELKVSRLVLYLNVNYYTDVSRGQTANAQEQIELDKATDFDKYECWILDNFNNNSLLPFDLSSLKEEDEAYLMGEGKVKISKVFGFPNKKNQICEVVNSESEPFTVCFDSNNLFYLPYKQHKTMLDEIDDGLNELLLMPYVSTSKDCPGIYNVYWKPLKESSRYIVSVYKCIRDDIKNVYHIADYDVDRNTCYLVLEKLLGQGFIFKVLAEDRNGNIIAKSRGISSGFPRYFKD